MARERSRRDREDGNDPERRDVDPRDIERRDVEPEDIDSREVDPGDIEPEDIEPRDIEPRDIEPREVDPRDIERREIDPRDIEPRDIEPRYVERREVERREVERRDIEPRYVERREVERREVERRDIEPRYIERREVEPRDIEPRDVMRNRFSESYSDYLDAAAEERRERLEDRREAREDRREEREERREEREESRDIRRLHLREEAADRSLEREIRADRYQEFEREELFGQQEDRRIQREDQRIEREYRRQDTRRGREFDDQVRLERISRFGGAFATDDDRAFKKVLQNEARIEKLEHYRELIQQCDDRLVEYHRMEDWLGEFKRAGLSENNVALLRTETRERQRESMTQISRARLLSQQANWDEAELSVLRNLDSLSDQEDRVYRDVLRACDEGNPEMLDRALMNLETCVASLGEITRRIPELASQRQREYDHSDLFGRVAQGAGKALKYGLYAAPVAFIGGCGMGWASGGFGGSVAGAFMLTFFTFPAAALIGAGIGYWDWKKSNEDHFDFSIR